MKRRKPTPTANLPDDPALIAVEIERRLRAALRSITDLRADLGLVPQPNVLPQQLSLLEPRP